MGSFASSLFSVMLSWIRGAVSYGWQAVSTEQGGSLIQWLAQHWLSLAIILCLIGMVTDTVVHLFRWQPYKVWASFFRRITGQVEEETFATDRPRARLIHRHWVYADGTARTEAVEQDELPPEEAHPWQDVAPTLPRYDLDDAAYRQQFARPQEQAVPTAGLEDYPQPNVASPQEEIEEPVEAERRQTMPRPKRRLSRESTRAAFQQLFVNHDEDELDLRYKPAQPAVDKAQAYNKPYYPPQWKPPAEAGDTYRDEERTEP